MKILLALFATIACCFFIVEAYNGRVRVIPRTMNKDPWLIPKDGVLVTENTPIYLATRDENAIIPEVQFYKIPGVMEQIITLLSKDPKFRRATVGNITNPRDYPNLKSPLPSSVPGQWPQILYPKVFVVVAYDLLENLGKDLKTVIPYLLAFWNGVDMLFRSIENPKIRFNIAGIMIETEPEVFDYLAPHSDTNNDVNGRGMYQARDFWNSRRNEIPLESYDQVVTMTTRSLCADLDHCQASALGKGWIDSMCTDDSTKWGPQRVILFTDDAKFSGIPIVAHELGHTLGMYHDDDQRFHSEEVLKSFPSCRNVGHGHVMGAIPSGTVYQEEWSQCSLEQLEHFIKTKNPTCLYKPPEVGKIHIPRLLPGKLTNMNVRERCQACGYPAVCEDSISWECRETKCKSFEESFKCVRASPLVGPPGTPCEEYGPDAFCMYGKCVTESHFT